jgi:hypothetical protein
MPFPTAVVADAVTYKNSAGVTVPALAASADGGSGVISLFVDDPAGAYFVHVVPKDLTGARFNSWNWPSSSSVNTGDVTLTAVGSTPSANGASLSGQALTLQPADGSHPGLVTAGSQTIGGAKTFSSSVTVSGFNYVAAGAGFGNAAGGASQGLAFSGSDTTVVAGGNANHVYLSSNGGVVFADATSVGVEVPTVGQSFILKSPDGTRWKLAVADTTGVLTAVLA